MHLKAGNADQIQAVVDEGLVQLMIEQLEDTDQSNPDLMLRERLAGCAAALDSANRRDHAVAYFKQELHTSAAPP